MATYHDYDFIGFTYNGLHSLKDLKIYRTSSSGRYDETLTPTLKEKTQSIEGMDGLLYFGTKMEQKVFNIPFAFDGLTESEFKRLKEIFNGKNIYPLVFDETPYKVYMAKVTGNASIKYMCFEVGGQREYRGEGSLQFTCYYPYARTRHSNELKTYSRKMLPITYTKTTVDNNTYYKLQTEKTKTVPCGIIVSSDCLLSYSRPSYSGVSFCETVSISYQVLGEKTIRIFQEPKNISASSYAINPKTLAENKKILIHSISYTMASEKTAFTGTSAHVVSPSYIPSITQDGVTYQYQDCGAFGSTSALLDGKILNHFNIADFPNKGQWAEASGLPLHSLTEINAENKYPGDVPFPIKVSFDGLSEYTELIIGNLQVECETSDGVLIWDTNSGLVLNGSNKIIPSVGRLNGKFTNILANMITLKTGNNKENASQENISDYSPSIEYDYIYY